MNGLMGLVIIDVDQNLMSVDAVEKPRVTYLLREIFVNIPSRVLL